MPGGWLQQFGTGCILGPVDLETVGPSIGPPSDNPEIDQQHRDRNIKHLMRDYPDTSGNHTCCGTLHLCAYGEGTDTNQSMADHPCLLLPG